MRSKTAPPRPKAPRPNQAPDQAPINRVKAHCAHHCRKTDALKPINPQTFDQKPSCYSAKGSHHLDLLQMFFS